MSETKRSEGFCTVCGFEITSFEGLLACPSCGTSSVPCLWSNQVQVSVNWHELNVLTIFAERWWNERVAPTEPGSTLNPVFSIAERIRRQHPDRWKDCPLTLAGQTQQVVDEFGPGVQHNVPGVEGGKPLEENHE